MRIITDASTAMEVLVEIRPMMRLFTTPINCEAKAADSKNTAMPISSDTLRLLSTGPVMAVYSRGSMKPTTVTANVASTIMAMSLSEMLFFMYSSRSGMPSFFMGSGV